MLIQRIREKRQARQLTRLKPGKLVWTGDSFCVKGVSWDVPWQTDRILAIFIRDYLRFFIRETPAVGSCVIPDDLKDPLGWFSASDETCEALAQTWKNKVNAAADDFDALRLLIERRDGDDPAPEEEIKGQTRKAFSGLVKIYGDLNW